MSAVRTLRTAWWRRWAGLPVIVALFFATSAIAPAAAPAPGPAPLAVQVVGSPAQHPVGQRPDVRVDARGGPGTVAPELAAFAWLSARAGVRSPAWWHLRQDGDGHRAQARGRAYQGRGPPGRRAADASS